MLSALAHSSGPPGLASRITHATVTACGRLDAERAVLYSDLVITALDAAARKEFDGMIPKGYVFKSDLAVLNQAKGRAEGEAEGEAKGRAEGVLRVLDARGVPVSDRQRARILACRDLSRLDRFLDQAAIATKASELFPRAPVATPTAARRNRSRASSPRSRRATLPTRSSHGQRVR